jgi:hypothetical protein
MKKNLRSFFVLASVVLIALLSFGLTAKAASSSLGVAPAPSYTRCGDIGATKANGVTEGYCTCDGIVNDQSGKPLVGATVTINGIETKTNLDGSFEVSTPIATQYLITVAQSNYALVSRVAQSCDANLELTMQKAEVFPIDPSVANIVKDASQTQIKFPPNAFVDSAGKPPLPGTKINVAMHTYDLANEAMPGDMTAINSAGQTGYMESAGAFWAEFTDDAGNKYNLAPGQKATVSLPAIQTNQTSVGLWSYDETKGLWIEEGVAQLGADGRFEGQVSHFSVWNFDFWKPLNDAACVAFSIDQSFVNAFGNGTVVQIKALVTPPPLSGLPQSQLNFFTAGLHVLYNIPANSMVEFFVPPMFAPPPYATVNAGAAWGPGGVPAYPYTECNGLVKLVVPRPAYSMLTTRSLGAQDGWVLESGENTNVGGSMNSIDPTFNVGDDALRRQYRGILSFDTGVLPDTAVITGVTLRTKLRAIVGGGNPVLFLNGFMVDIRNGYFGVPALQITDFQAAPSGTFGAFAPALTLGWYNINLTPGSPLINKLALNAGLTQMRLRFSLDDNNDAIANYLMLYSGDAAIADRPQLIIGYYVP